MMPTLSIIAVDVAIVLLLLAGFSFYARHTTIRGIIMGSYSMLSALLLAGLFMGNWPSWFKAMGNGQPPDWYR